MDDQQQLNGGDLILQQATPQHDDVEGKIFVGGLSWQTTEESMRFHFEKFGELSDIAIMIDKRTGQPRYDFNKSLILPVTIFDVS
jgi:RNA recognition motif-containing protein